MSAAQYTLSSEEMTLPSLSLVGLHTLSPPKRHLEDYGCVVLTDVLPQTNTFFLTTVNDIFDLYKPRNETPLLNQLHTTNIAQEIFGDTEALEGEVISILRNTLRRVAKTKTLPTYR